MVKKTDIVAKRRFEKFVHSEILTYTAENTTLQTQAIDTHEDILEISLRGVLDWTVSIANAQALISVYQIIETLQLTVGSVKIWDLEKQQIQFASALWQTNNFCNEYLLNGGLPSVVIGANHKIEFNVTIPCFIPKNTSNLKLKMKVGDLTEIYDDNGTTDAFVGLTLDVIPRYFNLDSIPSYKARKGTFRIENSLYNVSANGDKTVDFKEGYILDSCIFYCSDNDTTLANRTYSEHLGDYIDSFELKHEGDTIISCFGEVNKILAQEIGLSIFEFTKVHDDVIFVNHIPFVYFLNIDDIPVTSNTKLTIDYNASANTTYQLNVIFFYYK